MGAKSMKQRIDSANARDIIIDAFIELLSQYSMDKVTVNDIVKKSGVSRQTFYNYFSDKFELLQCIYKEEFDRDVEYAKGTSFTYVDVWYNLFMRRRKFYQHAFEIQGYSSLTTFLVNLHHKRATEIIRQAGVVIDERQRIRLKIFNYGLVCMMHELLKKGTELTGDELDEIFKDAAPDFLQQAWGFYTHADLNIIE